MQIIIWMYLFVIIATHSSYLLFKVCDVRCLVSSSGNVLERLEVVLNGIGRLFFLSVTLVVSSAAYLLLLLHASTPLTVHRIRMYSD